MPDLTPYLPLFTAIVTTLAALGGVGITTWATRKTAERQFMVEQKREDARLVREDGERARTAESERTDRARAKYREVAELFLGDVSTIRTWVPMPNVRDQEPFQRWWDQQWSIHGEMRMLRSVSGIENDDRRNKLARVVQAVTYYDGIADYFFRLYTWQAEVALKVGFDLASAWARDQEPDDDLDKRYRDLTSDLDELLEKWRFDDEIRRESSKPKPAPKRTRKPRTPKLDPDAPKASSEGPTEMPV